MTRSQTVPLKGEGGGACYSNIYFTAFEMKVVAVLDTCMSMQHFLLCQQFMITGIKTNIDLVELADNLTLFLQNE